MVADPAQVPDGEARARPRVASAGCPTSSRRPTSSTTTTTAWTGADFGDKLPSQVFREHVQTCFIDDDTGLRNRDHIGVDTITWECDYPHSDSTWPQSPEVDDEVARTRPSLPDDEIDMVTWENACRWYQFDPFEHRTREECTVGALRAQATDVDTTPREYGGFDAHRRGRAALDKDNATNFLSKNNTMTAPPDATGRAPISQENWPPVRGGQAAPPPVSS